MRYLIDKHGADYIAHLDDGHDCAADDANDYHGVSDHPTAALRALLKKLGL